MNIKDFISVGDVFGYFFRKSDPNRPKNFNTKMMHGVNRLAIFIFIICVVVMIIRALR